MKIVESEQFQKELRYPDIRDMVYRGYTIVYEIDKANAQIILLSIFNKNLPDL